VLFDLRGKRKRLIQVIYASLALLMGGGLVFFGIGSDTQGGLFDAFSDSGGSAAGTSFSDDAEDIEERLQADPRNENLLLELVRTRYNAGNSNIQVDESGQQAVTTEAREQFELAADAWDRYLEVEKGKPNPNVALLAANTFFTLAQTSPSAAEADANVAAAAEAQRVVAERRPSLGTVSTLAIYSYYALDFETGDRAAKRALAEAPNEGQRRSLERQLDSIRGDAKKYQRQKNRQRRQGGGAGGEALENPLGGLSGAGSGLSPAPAP
jgi:hypothetical protein